MDCAISCNLFEKFSTFLHWELQRQVGVGTVFHYLDDFLFLGSSGSNECACLMQGFQNLCEIQSLVGSLNLFSKGVPNAI